MHLLARGVATIGSLFEECELCRTPVMSAIFFLQACSRHFSVIFSRFASFHERAEQRATIFEFHLS